MWVTSPRTLCNVRSWEAHTMEGGGGAGGDALVGDRLAAALETAAREFWLEVCSIIPCGILTVCADFCVPGSGVVTQQSMPRSWHRHQSSAITLSGQQRGGSQAHSHGSALTPDVLLYPHYLASSYYRVDRAHHHEVALVLRRARVHLNCHHRRARHPWMGYALPRVADRPLWVLPKAPRQKWPWTRLTM